MTQLFMVAVSTIVMIVISEYIMRSGLSANMRCRISNHTVAEDDTHIQRYVRYRMLSLLRNIAYIGLASSLMKTIGTGLIVYAVMGLVGALCDTFCVAPQCPTCDEQLRSS